MRRPRIGSVLSAAALAISAVIPLVAAPAGAANSCDAGEFPASFAAQSGLKVDCSADAGVVVNHIEIHDSDNVVWHHGTAQSIVLTPKAPTKATTLNSTTIHFTAGRIENSRPSPADQRLHHGEGVGVQGRYVHHRGRTGQLLDDLHVCDPLAEGIGHARERDGEGRAHDEPSPRRRDVRSRDQHDGVGNREVVRG